VVSSAESLAEAISLAGGTLRIGSVRSQSVTTYTDGAGTPETKTSMVVDGLIAGGTRFGVGPDGFVVLGQPVPSAPKEAQALLDQILGPAGLSLRFVQSQTLPGGGQAAALEIMARQTQPQFPSSTVSLRLGGATSTVSLGEGPLPGPVVDVPGTETIAPPADGGGPVAGSAAGVPEPSATAAAPFPASPAPLSSAGTFGAGPAGGGTAAAFSDPDPAGVTSGAPGAGVASGESVPPSGSAPEGTELAAQPIVRPREIGAARLIYGLVGAGAALMLLLGGAITKRGRTAWLDV
jgi:hypothetical protein